MDNYKKSLKTLLITAFLLFFSIGAAQAQDNPVNDPQFQESQNIIQSIFDADVVFEGENKDLAHSYFAQLFGEFIFVNWGVGDADDVTLLSRVLGFTNILALILGIVIVYYVIVGGAVNTAQAGEVLGKSWSSVWLPLRVSMGFGSIMPANLGEGNPFSVAQIFILWLIMIGSNAATVLWNTTVDAIANGSNPSISMETIPQTDGISNAKILMCVEEQLNYWGRDDDNPQRVAHIKGYNEGNPIIVQNYLVTSRGAGTHSIANIDFSSISNGMDYISEITFARGCGSITLPSPSQITETFNDTDRSGYVGGAVASNYKVVAQWKGVQGSYSQLGESLNKTRDLVVRIRELTAPAKSFMKNYKDRNESTLGDVSTAAESLNKTAFDYSVSLAEGISSGVDASISSENGIAEEMKKGGWVIAGKWFYEISAAAEIKNSVIGQFSKISSYQSPDLCDVGTDYWLFSTGDESCADYAPDYAETQSLMDLLHKEAIALAKAKNQPLGFTESVVDPCTDEECNNESMSKRLSTTLGGGILNMLSDGDVKAIDGSANPFTTLSSMGHTMNQIGLGAWAAVGYLYTFTEVVEGFGSGSPAKGFAAKIFAPLTFVAGSLIPLVVAMLSLGFTLAYVIPFLPIMTWTIMVIGYLVTTIEAVVASPLAVILMVTPEGEGISGTRLERAMQLITMAVLKPSLMVIGVIASISVSYVAFAVVNRFFWETAEYVLHGSIFDIIAVISIYVIIAFQVVRLIVSVMFKLPDQILDWFASGVGRQFGENEVGSVAQQTGDQMKAGAGQVGQGAGKLIGEKRRNAMYEKSRRKDDAGAEPA